MSQRWILVAAPVALLAVAAAAFTVRDDEPPELRDPRVELLEARLSSLDGRLARLDERLETLLAQPVVQPATRISETDLQAAVERALADRARHGAAPAAAAAPDEDVADGGAGDTFDLDAAVAKLTSGALAYDEFEALWAEVVAAGQIDQAITMIEGMVDQDPTNPDLRTKLGNAYLQKLFTVGDGPSKGLWAIKADGAFDKALEVDPNHWEARYTKAVSLSFWPPLFGKQAEAVKQFETVIAQQEREGGLNDGYASSYVFLGNLYQQQGNPEKAKEVWQKGSALYPDQEELKKKLAGD